MVQPHHAPVSGVTSGTVSNLSESTHNVSAPSTDLEMVITTTALQKRAN